jgi:hypothetical protein
VHSFSVVSASVCTNFFIYSLEVKKQIMQHLYNVQLSTNTNTSAINIPAANTSSAELCSYATDDMTLSNEIQNAISAVSVV